MGPRQPSPRTIGPCPAEMPDPPQVAWGIVVCWHERSDYPWVAEGSDQMEVGRVWVPSPPYWSHGGVLFNDRRSFFGELFHHMEALTVMPGVHTPPYAVVRCAKWVTRLRIWLRGALKRSFAFGQAYRVNLRIARGRDWPLAGLPLPGHVTGIGWPTAQQHDIWMRGTIVDLANQRRQRPHPPSPVPTVSASARPRTALPCTACGAGWQVPACAISPPQCGAWVCSSAVCYRAVENATCLCPGSRDFPTCAPPPSQLMASHGSPTST